MVILEAWRLQVRARVMLPNTGACQVVSSVRLGRFVIQQPPYCNS